MTEVRFTVPGQPRGKGRPRTAVRGKFATIYTDDQTKSYEGTVAIAAHAAMGVAGVMAPFDCAVAVSIRIRLIPPGSISRVRRERMLNGTIQPTVTPDADNVAKAVTDACERIVYLNDKQITGLTVWKTYATTAGVDVRITTETGP